MSVIALCHCVEIDYQLYTLRFVGIEKIGMHTYQIFTTTIHDTREKTYKRSSPV